MKKICRTDDLAKVDRARCRGVEIYSPKRFYPIFGRDSVQFFDPKAAEKVLSGIENIMGFHFWNSYSKDKAIPMGNADAYDLIAEQYCPLVYAEHNQF